MPGSGKTTLGKILAEKLNYSFLDMDDYIEEKTNKTIKSIFENEGEESFRDLETKVCREIVSGKRLVIASGGGVIKKSINIQILKKECIIVFIDRPVKNIISGLTNGEIENRPLLKGKREKIELLYNERYELYKNYCDLQILNDKSIAKITDEIINTINTINTKIKR